MPRDGSGVMSLVTGNPVSTGTTISSTTHNATEADIATEITRSLAKDGQTVPTANLPMGTYRHTNCGDSSARNQYAATGQVQDGSFNKAGSVSGTNTITASLTPAISSYSAHMTVVLTPANTNTGAVTLALNGLTALDVLKDGGASLVAGDLVSGVPALLVLDTGGDDWILINPQPHQLLAIKTVDESVSSSTTLQDDNEISVAIPSAGIWRIEFALRATTGSDNSIKHQFTYSGTVLSGSLGGKGYIQGGGAAATDFMNTSAGIGATKTTTVFAVGETFIAYSGYVKFSNTGTFKWQWAQNASNASAITVQADTHLILTKLT